MPSATARLAPAPLPPPQRSEPAPAGPRAPAASPARAVRDTGSRSRAGSPWTCPSRGGRGLRGRQKTSVEQVCAQISLPGSPLLRFFDVTSPRKLPAGMRIPPLTIKILLESNSLKSRIVVRRLAVKKRPQGKTLRQDCKTSGKDFKERALQARPSKERPQGETSRGGLRAGTLREGPRGERPRGRNLRGKTSGKYLEASLSAGRRRAGDELAEGRQSGGAVAEEPPSIAYYITVVYYVTL